MTLDYKARLAALVAAQLAVLLTVLFAVYRPSLAEIDGIEKDISLMAAKQSELCSVLDMRPNPDADIARIKAEIARLEQRIPPESRVSWLSARIAQTMRAHHVDLRSATRWNDSGRHPAVPELKRLRKTAIVRCTAHDLQQFLEALNRLPFAVGVEDLVVVRNENRGAVSATIDLAAFVLRASETAADPLAGTFGRGGLD